MEREVWMRGGMVLSILGLVVLILITPSLLGRPPSQIGSLPVLIIGMSQNDSAFIVHLTAVISQYQYDTIRLTINGTDPSVNGTYSERDAYSLHRWVPGNVTFSANVYFVDQDGNYFEYNVTAHREVESDNRTAIVVTFPYERDGPTTPVVRHPPEEDFRKAIPLRGRIK